MALSRQPAIATEPITRIPDEIPIAKNSARIRSLEPSIKPTQPIKVSELPTRIRSLEMSLFAVFTPHCKPRRAGVLQGRIALRTHLGMRTVSIT